jgi:hypothetical protein
MRVFSNRAARLYSPFVQPSPLLDHKELRQLLDAMIRWTKLTFEKTNNLLPFAITLNDQGKIQQLALSERPARSAEETGRSIESGLKLIAQQTTCNAIGFCSEVRFLDGSNAIDHAEIVFLLEHRDGCAYRVVFPDFLEPKHWNAQRTAPRFFVRTKSFSASTSTRW